MSITIFTLLTLFSISSNLVSGHFFPNVSSVPPWLESHNATGGRGAWDGFNKFSGCGSGDKVNGLAKLKQYFHDFGYFDQHSPVNFTDDFDEALESAIRTYQKNFNLDPTGRLDDQTLEYIVKPRCGNPDMVNGTTTMNSGKTASGDNTTSFHSVAHYTFFPGSPRWPRGNSDLTFAFQPENQLSDDVKRVFRRAFARWAEVIPITFTETASFSAADIKVGFYRGDHGDGEPFDGVLGTLAHAFSPPSGMFHLDGSENWLVSGDAGDTAVPASAVDLESVAVHEIGHVLGLGHSSVETAIMFPTISSGQRKVDLAGDDVDGIQSLYGANPNYNRTDTTSSTQQSETNSQYSVAARVVVGPARWSVVAALLAVGSVMLTL